jgi:predicted nucleic acid-binding protein
MRVFFDAGAFLKVLKKEKGYEKAAEWLRTVLVGEHEGFTDTVVIAEIVYAFLAQGLDDEAVEARAYIEGFPNLTVIEEVPTSISHRGAELKKKYFRRAGKTFFSLYDGIHLALAEQSSEVILTSDSDFKSVTEVKVEFV